MISALAEDYYCIAGYVGWCDLSDPSLRDHLQRLNTDPLLVGLRYDVSDIEGDYLLCSMVSQLLVRSTFLITSHILMFRT